jgi:hypothetical protein
MPGFETHIGARAERSTLTKGMAVVVYTILAFRFMLPAKKSQLPLSVG